MLIRRSMVASVFVLFGLVACKDKDTGTGTGMVSDASSPPPVSAEAGPVDTSQCAGCNLVPQQAWTFEGIFRDEACTDPLAQTVTTACGAVPAVGAVSITYADEVGSRKANESANITLVEQVSPDAPRFRKAGTKCVKANEAALHVTPMGCAGQKVCRDASGVLACAGCRTLSNSCPNYEETRTYATINDPALKKAAGGSGRLSACCNAISAVAKSLGPSPEAGLLNTAALQCQALVAQAGPNGTAPELGAIRTMLAGRSIPACNGL